MAGEDPWKGQMAALGAFIRSRRTMADLSLRELAERTRVSNAYLSQIERGVHEPSLRVLHAIALALDLPLAELLARAGMLDSAGSGPAAGVAGTEAAIESDPQLTAAQRFALVSIYRSFVGSA